MGSRGKVVAWVLAVLLAASAGVATWWFAFEPGQRARATAEAVASAFARLAGVLGESVWLDRAVEVLDAAGLQAMRDKIPGLAVHADLAAFVDALQRHQLLESFVLDIRLDERLHLLTSLGL